MADAAPSAAPPVSAIGASLLAAQDLPALQAMLGMRSLGDILQIATAPTSGTVVATNASTTIMLIDNPGLLLSLTVPLPAIPVDLQRFTVACNAAITVMTVSGGTVRGALAGLAAGGFMTFRYSATLNVWFRTA